MKISTPWKIGTHKLRLLSFTERSPGTWEKYLQKEREYWGEDRISGPRSDCWSWKGSEEKWLVHTENGYKNWVKYCSSWNGIFRANDEIDVMFSENPSVLKLARVQNGNASWGETIELWLIREIGLLPPRVQLRCELYTFGERQDHDGVTVISHLKGVPDVVFHQNNSTLIIGDAHFQLL